MDEHGRLEQHFEFNWEIRDLMIIYYHGREEAMTEQQKIKWWEFIETDAWKLILLNLKFWNEVVSQLPDIQMLGIDVSPTSPAVLFQLDKFRRILLKQVP